MRKTIKRLSRTYCYLWTLSPNYFITMVLFNLAGQLHPFLAFYLSKQIVDAVMRQTTLIEVLHIAFPATAGVAVLMIVEGFFQSQSERYKFKLFKRHDAQKAEKIAHLPYQVAMSDAFQSDWSELQHLEATGIHNLASFGTHTGRLCGTLVGIACAGVFSIDFFRAPLVYRGGGTFEMTVLCISAFVLLNTLSLKVTLKANKKTGQDVSQTAKEQYRYIRAYMELLYNYKVTKDVQFYCRSLATRAGEIYKETMQMLYASFWSVFGRGVTHSGIYSDCLSVIIALFVGLKGLYGSITVGEVLFYIGVLRYLLKNVNAFLTSFSILAASDAYRVKLLDFYDLEEQNTGANADGQFVKAAFEGEWVIELEAVSFKYPDTEHYVLKNIDLTLRKGDRIAFVGLNGSGKTTLIHLILGLYQPTNGQIKLNGRSIQELNQKAYIRAFSVVFQDFKLPALTIGENLAASATYDGFRVQEVLEKVGMGAFYKRCGADGYLYRNVHENGTEISGGEAQKIAMARALYKDGAFYILDEPTAALDPVAEAEMYATFNQNIGNKTVVYISHRLSSCRFCDVICVLHKGKLVQKGTHDSLVKKTDGQYHTMWRAQAQYYRTG